MNVDDQDFYELMQGYRHAPLIPQDQVVKEFEAVKAWITAYADEREKEIWMKVASMPAPWAVRNTALEEAAKVSEVCFSTHPMGSRCHGWSIAERIRALKSTGSVSDTPAPGGAK